MKIKLLLTGKTQFNYLEEAVRDYSKRIGHYCRFDCEEIAALKNTKALSENEWKKREAALQLASCEAGDYLVLLDEKGKSFRSVEFAALMDRQMSSGLKQMIFLIGGPYGFDETVYQRANLKLSLSNFTFSHQIVRLIFLEQLYRAFSIIKNEPYHHES